MRGKTYAVNDSTSNQHADVLRGAYNNTADNPTDTPDLNGALAAKSIGDDTGDEGAEPRTGLSKYERFIVADKAIEVSLPAY